MDKNGTERSPYQLYPLTAAQGLVLMAWKYTLSKQVMNIPTICLIHESLDMHVLREAVERAIQRNDAFGLRIAKAGKERRQYFAERKALVFAEVDFSGQTMAQMDAFFAKIGRRPIRLNNSPLAKVYLVRAPGGHCGIYTCVCHLMMDSWAIVTFYRDALLIYRALKDGAPMPRDMGSFERIIQREMAYVQSERCAKDREFWENEVSDVPEPPTFTHINGGALLEKVRRRKHNPAYRFGPVFLLRQKAAHEILAISREEMEEMVAFCDEHRLSSPNQLIILGMRTYLAKVNNRPKGFTFYTMVARRSSMDEKYGTGMRVSNLPFTSFFPEDMIFEDALNAIMDKQGQMFRHADFDQIAVMAMQARHWGLKMAEGVITAGLTYQPLPLALTEGPHISTKWYTNGSAPQSCYLTIMDDDGSGGLRCYYEYNVATVKPETIRNCHAFIMKVIKAGMANPAITLGQLHDLPLVEAAGTDATVLSPALD